MIRSLMAIIRYNFRPSLFQTERTVVLDDQALTVHMEGGVDQRVPWESVEEVHIEPVTAGDDNTRLVLNLSIRNGAPVQIDSVNVRGAGDFEHKTEEFKAVLGAIHRALSSRSGIRYRIGMRRGVMIAWRIALLLTVAAGIFGVVAAVITEQYDAIIYAGVFVAFGGVGLLMLAGRRGPVAYDPAAFIASEKKM